MRDRCPLWRENHVWSAARAAALARAGKRCEVCRSPDVEVHHDPPVGALGYGQGCQHHQDRLRVLCRAHHREADRAIRAEKPVQLSLIAA